MLVVYSWLGIHFRSDESSWKASSELLVEIAGHGEDTGFEVPCLIVAAKDDLDSFPMAIQESTRVFSIDLFICMILYLIENIHIAVHNYWIVKVLLNVVNDISGNYNYDTFGMAICFVG